MEAASPELVERKALQETYGGRTQGGIGPSRRSPNVLVFSDPKTGEKHGYVDDWMDDGLFHYTGEGQFGDQRMVAERVGHPACHQPHPSLSKPASVGDIVTVTPDDPRSLVMI